MGLLVPGVAEVTPVVSRLDNAVLFGPYDQDRRDLAAIDPDGFAGVSMLVDSFFVGQSADDAISALQREPNAVLVDTQTLDDLGVEEGNFVEVLLARGTDRQVTELMHIVGVFERFPGFPRGVHLVMNVADYQAATGSTAIDFYLARTSEHGDGALAQAARSLRAGPGQQFPIAIDSRATTFDRDQSSLTALHVTGLVDLVSIYTVLMTAAVAIFVFGLTLQRRREYVIMRAQGMHVRELRQIVLAESSVVAIGGLATGVAVGIPMADLLVQILRPLFVLDPGLGMPSFAVARLAGTSLASGVVAALIATAMIRRLPPSEILGEP